MAIESLKALPNTAPETCTGFHKGVPVEIVKVKPDTDMLALAGLFMWGDFIPPVVKTVGILQDVQSTRKPLRLGYKRPVVQPLVNKRPGKTDFELLANKLRHTTHMVTIVGEECDVPTFPHETMWIIEINGKECEVLIFSREPIESK